MSDTFAIKRMSSHMIQITNYLQQMKNYIKIFCKKLKRSLGKKKKKNFLNSCMIFFFGSPLFYSSSMYYSLSIIYSQNTKPSRWESAGYGVYQDSCLVFIFYQKNYQVLQVYRGMVFSPHMSEKKYSKLPKYNDMKLPFIA